MNTAVGRIINLVKILIESQNSIYNFVPMGYDELKWHSKTAV